MRRLYSSAHSPVLAETPLSSVMFCDTALGDLCFLRQEDPTTMPMMPKPEVLVDASNDYHHLVDGLTLLILMDIAAQLGRIPGPSPPKALLKSRLWVQPFIVILIDQEFTLVCAMNESRHVA